MAKSEAIYGATLRGVDTSAAEYDRTADSDRSITSGVVFKFDTGNLAVENPFTLKCDSGEAVDTAAIIGCRVTDSYTTNTDLVIVFDGRIALSVSLREEDFIGPEAAVFSPVAGNVVVFS